jgi:hypothetical protein
LKTFSNELELVDKNDKKRHNESIKKTRNEKNKIDIKVRFFCMGIH